MKKIPIDTIKSTVARVFDVTVEEIESRNRYKLPALARQFSMHYALIGRTLEAVGAAFDRHHGNVHHANEKIEFLKETDWECRAWATEIEKAFDF